LFFGSDIAGISAGLLVGFVLSLVGGGGSVLGVPLLVYGVGVTSPHVAIGTSAVAVAGSAFGNLALNARAGMVKWRCAAVFTGAGVIGAAIGAQVAKTMDGHRLLALFGGLMIVVAILMLRRRGAAGNPDVRLTAASSAKLTPALLGLGMVVGILSGFFGIGGGFLIVPGLILSTGMPFTYAVSTSLVAVTGFGVATATSYALSGLVDWRLALFFMLGGFIGGWIGMAARNALASRATALPVIFAGIVALVGVYVIARSLSA
jgi:uncharacterized membrane protein YfcA